MTLILELTPAQEAALHRRAADAGQQPADFLLTAAGLTDDETPTGSAYDLFRGLIGGFASESGNLSQNTGKAFTDIVVAKHKAERE